MRDSKIVEIYVASNYGEAHLLKNLLEAEGIPARVVGEFLPWGGVTMPFDHRSGHRICVSESDAERARQILHEYETRRTQVPPPTAYPWTCPQCGENVEAEFEVCWNCQTPRSRFQHHP